MKQKIIFTLGFEKLSMVDFVRMVKDKEVSSVIDIRAKNMVIEGRGKFSPDQLRDILKNLNIKYTHLPEAGLPQELQTIPGGNGHGRDFRDEYKSIIIKNKKLHKKIKELFQDDRILILGYKEDVKASYRLPFIEVALGILNEEFKIEHLTSKDLKPLEIPPPEPLP